MKKVLFFLILISLLLFLILQNSVFFNNKRYIFIDGGAHKGESIEAFKSTKAYTKHDWTIYSFEANPELIPELLKKYNGVNILSKAIWINDGHINFYIGTESTLSSSVIKDKTTGKLNKIPINIPCVDFSKWCTENFKKEDYVVLKLDIEGAEYEVLDKMLKDNSISLIDVLYIEFHNIRVHINPEKDNELIEIIISKGIKVVYEGINPLPIGERFNDCI